MARMKQATVKQMNLDSHILMLMIDGKKDMNGQNTMMDMDGRMLLLDVTGQMRVLDVDGQMELMLRIGGGRMGTVPGMRVCKRRR